MLKHTVWLSRRTWATLRALQPHQRWRRSLASVVDDTPPIIREETIRLRQYQEECIQSVLSYLKSDHKRLGISLATGSGKTVIFTRLIDRVKNDNSVATKTMILAHRRELVEQAAKHCVRAYPEKSVEIEMGNQHASGVADITVASIRSLQMGRLDKYDPETFKLVLVDEAHHIVAPGYLEVLEHFGLDTPHRTGPALVGVSATFSRFDGLSLGTAIDHIVYHKDYVDMIGEKWLCDVKFTTIKSNANLSRVKTNKDGDFRLSDLSSAVNNNDTNEITVKAWLEEAGHRKSTLVFCVDLNHVASLTDTFRRYGIDARFITGDTKKKIRGERLDEFKAGRFPVLLNCGVFTEGTDIPNIDCIVLARPTKSRNLLVQMIGRGMRLHPGKVDCHVLDMVASLETGIVTVPTLFGLDPGELVKDATSQELRELKMKRESLSDEERAAQASQAQSTSSNLDTRSLTFTHYDSVHDLIEDTSGERHIRALSPNAWVQIDSNKYILAAKGGVLTLERRYPTDQEITVSRQNKQSDLDTSSSGTLYNSDRNTPLYHIFYKYTLPFHETTKSPWSKPHRIATAETLPAALSAADTYAATKFERRSILTSSPWRSTPASPSQLDFLNKLRAVSAHSPSPKLKNSHREESDHNNDNQELQDFPPLTPDDLTKGQAGDMITKIKFGARGRFEKLRVQRTKIEKARERFEQLRSREVVNVGPLEN